MITRRATLLVLAALSMPLFESRDARADSQLVGTVPVDGTVVEQPPDRVLLRFSSGIESRSARISLIGPSGESSLLIEGSGGEPFRELSIPVPDQGRGRYIVRWEIVAAGGNRFRGMLRFVVSPRIEAARTPALRSRRMTSRPWARRGQSDTLERRRSARGELARIPFSGDRVGDPR